MVFHGLDFNGAKACRVGNGGTAHACEHNRAHHIDVAQAAFHPTHQCQCVVVNAVGNAGIVHEVAGQNKEGHGQQGKAVNARHHAVNHHKGGRALCPEQVDERGARHGNGNRNATTHQQQEQNF